MYSTYSLQGAPRSRRTRTTFASRERRRRAHHKIKVKTLITGFVTVTLTSKTWPTGCALYHKRTLGGVSLRQRLHVMCSYLRLRSKGKGTIHTHIHIQPTYSNRVPRSQWPLLKEHTHHTATAVSWHTKDASPPKPAPFLSATTSHLTLPCRRRKNQKRKQKPPAHNNTKTTSTHTAHAYTHTYRHT